MRFFIQMANNFIFNAFLVDDGLGDKREILIEFSVWDVHIVDVEGLPEHALVLLLSLLRNRSLFQEQFSLESFKYWILIKNSISTPFFFIMDDKRRNMILEVSLLWIYDLYVYIEYISIFKGHHSPIGWPW